MRHRNLLLVAVALSSAFIPAAAWAGGAPAGALTYVGTVTDTGGKPLPGQQVKVSVFGSEADDGSVALCASKPVLSDALGNFSAPLSNCDAAVKANPDLWTEVAVGKSGTTTVLPRQRITPAAYALEASAAASASGALAAQISSLVAQVADLAGKVGKALTQGDLAVLAGDVSAIKMDVADLKAAPKTKVLAVNLTFGTGTAVEMPAGTLVAQFHVWVEGYPAEAALAPVFKIDGQKVGAAYAVAQQNSYGTVSPRLLSVNAVTAVTAGKHVLELNNSGTGTWSCSSQVKSGCSVLLTVFP